MKKSLYIMTAALLAAGITGCQSKSAAPSAAETVQETAAEASEAAETETEAEEETAAEEEAESEEETAADAGMVGMANPMQEKSSLAEVNEAVGCSIMEPGVMGVTEESFFTFDVSPRLGEYRFQVNGVDYSIRSAYTKGDISGIYLPGGETAGVAMDLELNPGEEGVLQLEKGFAARWYAEGFQYFMYSENSTDADLFQSVYEEMSSLIKDQAKADAEKFAEENPDARIIRPLPQSFFGEDHKLTDDCIANADLLTDSMDELEGTTVIRATLYTEDLYDTVDIGQMKAGDILFYGGDKMTVEKVEQLDGVYWVNGGLENGGCQLMPDEGGTFRAQELDDFPTYSYDGTTGLNFADDAVMNDSADLEQSDKYKNLTGDALKERLKDGEYSFDCYNTTIHIVNNSITEITRIYVP